jgi:hypothetical protein
MTSHRSERERERELTELAQRDPDALVHLWRDTAGMPGNSVREPGLDFRNVIIPAI